MFGLIIEADEAEQRQITIGIVMPVEESELLLAVGGIVSSVEIDGDAPYFAAQSFLLARDDGLRQRRT